MELCDRGSAEPYKAYCHGLMFTLAVLFTAYNVTAYRHRREPHLLRNTLLYGALAVVEALQIGRHAA